MNALDAALDLIGRGWSPLPVPYRTKAPDLERWQHLRITPETAPHYFNGIPKNVGVILGPASNGLTDVDLDCPEAIAVAPYFLPQQPTAIFGRPSKPSSHWLFRTTLSETSAKAVVEFKAPMTIGGAMLVEIRIGGGDKGAQTIMPGSVHESNEPIGWEQDREPVEVDGADLSRRVERLAAAAILARYWNKGSRHDAALTLGGFLARAGLKRPEVKLFVGAVARAGGDDEVRDRERAAEEAADEFEAGRPARGYPALKEVFGDAVADRVCEWLRYEPGSASERGGGRREEHPEGPQILFYGDKEPEPPPYLIKGILPQKQVAIVAGQHSAGKTFIGHDVSFSTMTALPFIDCEIERPGAVLWLGAEGANEVAIRLKAAAIHRTGKAMLGELPFAYQAFDVPTLTEADALQRLMRLVDETKAGLAARFPGTDLVLIVLDTLNSAAGFTDENSASETQKVFNVLRRLSDASGALVLVIDHYGKMTETGIRGSSAKSGAADAILAALADKDETTGKVENRRLAVTKLRGGQTGRIVPFELKPVVVNEWGSTHCGIVWDAAPDLNRAGPQKTAKPAWSGKLRLLKACIDRLIGEHGSEQQPFGLEGPKVRAIPVDVVRREFKLAYTADTTEAKQIAFKRALASAVEKDLIQTREIGASLQDWLWYVTDGRLDAQTDNTDSP